LVGSLGSEQDLLNVANSIVIDWGGINRRFKYKTEDVPGIQVALTVLVNETINSEWFTKYVDYLNFTHNPRIAAHSKIYETFEPNKWTIYDSRVAAALVCLVYKYWEQEEQAIASGVLQLPVPPRNLLGWQRPHPSEFPAVNNVHQASLAFVYASWLLRSVAEILRSRPQYGYPPTMEHAERYSPLDPNWQVYHVEMALWMMGNKEF